MSRLTDYQIKAMISRCDSSAELYARDGKMTLAGKSLAKAAEYRAELDARARGEAVQEPQEDRRR